MDNPPNVWITGAGGLIGHALGQRSSHFHEPRRLIPLQRSDLDLRDRAQIERRLEKEKPTVVLHCAAISKNPACTADPLLARQVNVSSTRLLADWCAAEGSQLVFLSTDLVFDGRQGGYTELDDVNPLSVYAETKVAAEEAVLDHPQHLVLRLSLNGGRSPTGDRGFNEDMGLAWARGRTLDLFTDEFRCPIAAKVTADAIWELVGLKESGLYHLCGAERLSRHQIGELLASIHPELSPKISPGSLVDYAGPPRSPDTSMDCAKVAPLLSFALPRFTEWVGLHGRHEF